jgi:hypothetical protein
VEFLTYGAKASASLLRLGMLFLALLVCPDALTAADAANEYTLKSAFLYKFASFVVWPDSLPSGPLRIGVLGEDPFGSALEDVVKGKSINGRAFEIRRLRPGREPGRCQILFISSTETRKLRAILDHLQCSPVLTVSDMPGFCEQGGAIRLGLEDNRVRLEINPDAAERAGLQLSSKLLSLARIVRQAQGAR